MIKLFDLDGRGGAGHLGQLLRGQSVAQTGDDPVCHAALRALLQSRLGIKFQISSNYHGADWRCNKRMTYMVPRTPPPELFA